MFNRDSARGLVVGLLLGGLGGFFLANMTGGRSSVSTSAALPVTPPAPPQGQSLDVQSHLFASEQAVQRDPKNLQAWIHLGNGYFDTHDYQKSVDAYAKALELDPNNPDVLTDQGVMYREMKQFDKALANWEKAQKLDPKHLQSLFNIGIVNAYDLGKPDKARAAWLKLIETAPGSPDAARAQQALASLGAQ